MRVTRSPGRGCSALAVLRSALVAAAVLAAAARAQDRCAAITDCAQCVMTDGFRGCGWCRTTGTCHNRTLDAFIPAGCVSSAAWEVSTTGNCESLEIDPVVRSLPRTSYTIAPRDSVVLNFSMPEGSSYQHFLEVLNPNNRRVGYTLWYDAVLPGAQCRLYPSGLTIDTFFSNEGDLLIYRSGGTESRLSPVRNPITCLTPPCCVGIYCAEDTQSCDVTIQRYEITKALTPAFEACTADSECYSNSCRAGFCCPVARFADKCVSCADRSCSSCSAGYELDYGSPGSYAPAECRASGGTQCVADDDCESNVCRGGRCCERASAAEGCARCDSQEGACAVCEAGYFALYPGAPCNPPALTGSCSSSPAQCISGECKGSCCKSGAHSLGCEQCDFFSGECEYCQGYTPATNGLCLQGKLVGTCSSGSDCVTRMCKGGRCCSNVIYGCAECDAPGSCVRCENGLPPVNNVCNATIEQAKCTTDSVCASNNCAGSFCCANRVASNCPACVPSGRCITELSSFSSAEVLGDLGVSLRADATGGGGTTDDRFFPGDDDDFLNSIGGGGGRGGGGGGGDDDEDSDGGDAGSTVGGIVGGLLAATIVIGGTLLLWKYRARVFGGATPPAETAPGEMKPTGGPDAFKGGVELPPTPDRVVVNPMRSKGAGTAV